MTPPQDATYIYWQTTAENERRRAEQNLRLAAERATAIEELQRENRELKATIEGLQMELDFYTKVATTVAPEITHHIQTLIQINAERPLKKRIEELEAVIEQLQRSC